MADRVQFELVTPERLLLSEMVEMVVVPGTEGNFGVLPGHAPLISSIRPGMIDVYEGQTITRRIFVVSGIAEVTPERCTVLADEAEPFEQVTAEQLADRERLAQEELTDAATDAERATAQKNLAIAKDLRRAQAYYASR
jgi:F-type H+-transporting ATPase subunit epsilon